MKTIGLIGGTSWISTVEYYRIINTIVNDKLGGLHSAKIILYSINFSEFKEMLDSYDWRGIYELIGTAAQKLKDAGADCIVICANTPHKVADDLRKAIEIPLIHIAEATAEAIRKKHLKRVGLLGTQFVMEESFFKDKLSDQGIEAIVPPSQDRNFIHSTIFNELGKNIFSEETKNAYLRLIRYLIETQGVQGMVFACTEIPLLIRPEECPVPVFDTTLIHARAAAEFALPA